MVTLVGLLWRPLGSHGSLCVVAMEILLVFQRSIFKSLYRSFNNTILETKSTFPHVMNNVDGGVEITHAARVELYEGYPVQCSVNKRKTTWLCKEKEL